MRLKISLLLILLIFSCLPGLSRVQAAETEEDTAASAEALSQWLTDHEASGGFLRLTEDIEWCDYLSVHAEAPITIDAGTHRIHLNSLSYLCLNGPVTVQGRPLPGNALFDAEADAQLSLGAAAAAEVRGDGAVAVRTRWEKGLLLHDATIKATGSSAAAIEVAEGHLAFQYGRIYAEGENAVCVDASRGSVDVFFSILEASGHNAASVRSGSGSLVDASSCQPEPENAVSVPVSGHRLSLSFTSNQPLFYQSILADELVPESLTLAFDAAGAAPARELSLEWTPESPLPRVPGKYRVSGTLKLPEDFSRLLEGFEPILEVELVDPAKPYLMPLPSLTTDGILVIPYFEVMNPDGCRMTLYISEDLGDSWRCVPSGTSPASSFITYNHMAIQSRDYFVPGKTYLLKMEVESPEISGVSNILELTISSDGDYEVSGFEGDRDGSDRGDRVVTTTPGAAGSQPDSVSDVTDSSVTYSHSQIMDMAAASPDAVTFFGSGIQLSAPAQALKDLVSGAGDILTVHCTLLGGSSYRIELIKNGKESIDFSETPLRVRVSCQLREKETLDQLSFKTADGTSASIVSYDAAAGQLELLVTAPGIYTLSSTWAAPASVPTEPASAQSVPAWWIIPALLIIAIAGLAVFRHRKRMV